MCPFGVTSLPADCCFSDLALNLTKSLIQGGTRRNATCFPHDILKYCSLGVKQQSLFFFFLAIVLSVLRFTTSQYPFGIFKMFLITWLEKKFVEEKECPSTSNE